MTAFSEVRPAQRTPIARYRHSLWLLTKRDLSVRYSTNALGYVWSILDPLLMAGIYYFVFVIVFHRGDKTGEDPYIVFLIAALLPWTWFNGVISDCAKVFSKESKLIRSTALPRSLWVNRVVLSKGIEFLLSLPVLAFFAIVNTTHVSIDLVWLPLAILIQTVLSIGLGLIVAPAVVFFKDLERAIRLILRLLFYASPIVYSTLALHEKLRHLMAFNPLTGIFGIYRAAFFSQELDWKLVALSAAESLVLLGIGIIVFRRSVPAVLKEM